MGTFELAAQREERKFDKTSMQEGFGNTVLVHNAQWFTRIRWVVVGVFALIGATGNIIPGAIKEIGFAPPERWPWILGGVLAFANAWFYSAARKLSERASARLVEANIWLQIVLDLVILTILVHIIGSTTTFISFTYLFHIVLACVFFSRRKSLLVTILAADCYLLCVVNDTAGVFWPAQSILLYPATLSELPYTNIIFAGSAIFVWMVVWYLVSHLAETLRKRDQQLNSANQLLLKADQETNQRVLRTTHDLKAPFSGIESNIEILRLQHWDQIPEPVRAILKKIEVRAQALRERIRDILLLGELRSEIAQSAQLASVDLQSVINSALEDLDEKARNRRVSLNVNIPPTEVKGNSRRLAILFSNVIANAIFYSREGSEVGISLKKNDGEVCVSIADHGIGIRDDALPHIFNEYFRAREAAEFNSMSTGLGLAIVREIALSMGLRLRVSSEHGKGTTFDVLFPKPAANGESSPLATTPAR